MSLKQLSNPDRILFLLEFIGNIVQHSTQDERLKRLIKVERLKRKIVPEPPVNLEPIGKSIIFNPPSDEFQKSKPIHEYKHTFHLQRLPRKIKTRPTTKKIKKQPATNMSNPLVSGHQTRNTEELMAKINKIVNDKNVQMMECPGPGKSVLVKVRNKVNVTKLNLNEAEIKNIIIYFSDYARIPIVGGILKTSVDDLMISAVVSDYAGSRFIINKRNPYDLIGGV